MPPPHRSRRVRSIRGVLGTGLRARLLSWVARTGFAARGIVYLMIGTLALMAALELRALPAGTGGALEAFGTWPLGPAWLFGIGLGLLAFMVLRLAQAVLDLEDHGRSALGVARRAGYGLSGALHGVLGNTALELSGDVTALRPEDPGHAVFQRALAAGFGAELLLGAALLVLVAGLGNCWKALSRGLARELEERPEGPPRWALLMGRAGYLARGLVLLLLGGFMAHSALDAGGARLVSLGRVLQALEDGPQGVLLLSATGFGLAAFGAFALVLARHGRLATAAPRQGP